MVLYHLFKRQTNSKVPKKEITEPSAEEELKSNNDNTSFPRKKQEQLATLLIEYMKSLKQNHHDGTDQNSENTIQKTEEEALKIEDNPKVEHIELPFTKTTTFV